MVLDLSLVTSGFMLKESFDHVFWFTLLTVCLCSLRRGLGVGLAYRGNVALEFIQMDQHAFGQQQKFWLFLLCRSASWICN